MKRLIKFTLVGAILALGLFLRPAATVSAATQCRAYSKLAVYVVCVRVSTQKEWVIDQSGATVFGPVTVTTSRQLTSSTDSITRLGQWKLGKPLRVSPKGLQYFIPFSGEQGFHYYPYVGAGYDSHGCVREGPITAKWLYTNVGGAILAGKRAEAHIMP